MDSWTHACPCQVVSDGRSEALMSRVCRCFLSGAIGRGTSLTGVCKDRDSQRIALRTGRFWPVKFTKSNSEGNRCRPILLVVPVEMLLSCGWREKVFGSFLTQPSRVSKDLQTRGVKMLIFPFD
jgi:hypothetical protein